LFFLLDFFTYPQVRVVFLEPVLGYKQTWLQVSGGKFPYNGWFSGCSLLSLLVVVGYYGCRRVWPLPVVAAIPGVLCGCGGGGGNGSVEQVSSYLFCIGTLFQNGVFWVIKGTGTRDLIWLKVVSLERSWWVGLTEDLYKFLKCFFIFLIMILKSWRDSDTRFDLAKSGIIG